MADIKSIQVDGIDYAIKDESARSNIGDLSQLATEAKGDLVSALNELSANAGSGSSPIQRVESLDESNLKNLRDLTTGSYVLYGYFRPYAGASNYLPFDNLLVNVYHVDEGSHLFEFSTANSEVNFIEILVDDTAEGGHTYSRTAINMLELNGLIGKLGNLNELATTEKGSVVAAINEVAASGGSGSGSGASVQADMAQNDPAQPDYVKNRTHWVEGSFEEILAETTLTMSVVSGYGMGQTTVDHTKITSGKNYKMVWDGVAYEAPAFEAGGQVEEGGEVITVVAIGNPALANLGEDNGIPFYGANVNSGGVLTDDFAVLTTDTAATHTLSISAGSTTYHPLDEAFIPDSVARKADALPMPSTAEAGQLIAVSEVDESGKVTKTETIEMPATQCVDLVNYDANVRAVNHRGYSLAAPENTLPAYVLSKKYGFTYVEADVSFTSDGVPVLLHDSTIDRTSSGSGSISAMTYAEVSQYDFGSWKSADYAGTKIPTFAEFIKLCKRLCLHPYIELKNNGEYTEGQIQELVAIVEANGMKGKVTWISFASEFLAYVKSADSAARLGYLVSSITSDTIDTVKSLRTDENEVFLDSSDYDAEAISLCIADDIPLEIWTINSKTVIEGMEGYITGVTSDNVHAGRHLYNITVNPVVTDALINVEMGSTGGSNNGSGGSAYAATYSGVTFLNDGSGFEINGAGYLTVPTDFMAGSDPWTIAFTIDSFSVNENQYGRFARGNNDVPSLFYVKSTTCVQAKLAYASASPQYAEIINDELVSLYSSNALTLNIQKDATNTFVFRNNGEYISLWINGVEALREDASRYTTEKYASTFSIGDNADAGYYLSYLKCSMLKAWNRGLTDEEIRIIS